MTMDVPGTNGHFIRPRSMVASISYNFCIHADAHGKNINVQLWWPFMDILTCYNIFIGMVVLGMNQLVYVQLVEVTWRYSNIST
jgi:hypothetical protein